MGSATRVVSDDRHSALSRHRAPALAVIALIVAAAAPLPAVAQQIITTGPQPYDRARVSGFWWRGETNGTITAPQLDDVPGVRGGLDVTEDLGVDGGANGWLFGADVGVARRHRFTFAFAGLSQDGTSRLGNVNVGEFIAATHVSLRDVRAAYKFLFVARGWLDAGVIGGVGYFDSDVDVAVSGPLGDDFDPDEGIELPPVVAISEKFDSPYPFVGGSLLLDAQDVVGIYVELTGFPSVEVGGQKGWLMDFNIDFIVSPTESVSLIAGYKRYKLSLEDGTGIGVNLVWDGFIVGVEYVF